MLYLIEYVGNYVWNKFKDAKVKGPLLESEEETLNKELQLFQNDECDKIKPKQTFKKIDADLCQKCVGKVTSLYKDYGIIDNEIEFSTENLKNLKVTVDSVVTYYLFKASDSDESRRAQVLNVIANRWDNGSPDICEIEEPKTYEVFNKTILTKVVKRNKRIIKIDYDNIEFDLDKVISDFVPVKGDYVNLTTRVISNENKKEAEVLEIISIECLRCVTEEGLITYWDEINKCGVINSRIYFSADFCELPCSLKIGNRVNYDAIESEQDQFKWRAISITGKISNRKIKTYDRQPENNNLNKKGIEISNNFNLETMNINQKKLIEVTVKNTSCYNHTLIKSVFHSSRRDSQIRLIEGVENNKVIKSGESIIFKFECFTRFMGYSDELFVFTFKGFNINRVFKLNVCDPNSDIRMEITSYRKPITLAAIEDYKAINSKTYIPGCKLYKPPPFVTFRIPDYYLKDEIWDMYSDYIENNCNKEIPFLKEELTMENYKNKLHTLLFCEEIHQILCYKNYDMDRACMTKCGNYLCLEIEDLFDRRPSLVFGDYVKVSNPWCEDAPHFQGYIDKIVDNKVYFSFIQHFTNKYKGEDLKVKFFISRFCYVKYHFAVDMAYSCLSKEILFPDQLIQKEPQVEFDSHKIVWCQELNDVQKMAVENILKGVARPLPYVIFGPPGTGKSVTIVETIMQILNFIPGCRIIVATPSNSASNLLARRLIEVGKFNPGYILRLCSANIIKNNKVPEDLKRYAGSVDIGIENSCKAKFNVTEDGIRHGISKSYIGRHKITIGTCTTLATLISMGFQPEHFTHVLVDEAGQCSEPEIMEALTLVNRSVAQIILAGDPLQLGPVVTSSIGLKYGLSLSYLERLLCCIPYKRDIIGNGLYNDGYDPRLITKLTYNYRSLQKVIQISNNHFYNGCLKSMVDVHLPWVKECDEKIISVIEMPENPGIIFHGVRGINYKHEDSPSWYNLAEASMILMFLCKLYHANFEPDEIGIITPYSQQVKCIHKLINDLGIVAPKIGSVEEFQGQERKIILMSTVRSQENLVYKDISRQLGFIKMPKRINVSITRAQIITIIFGNPHLLTIDPLWKDIISYTVKKGSYLGCNLPKELEEKDA